jgi:hypothetical protein
MMKANQEYLAKVVNLTEAEVARLMTRMPRELLNGHHDEKLSPLEAIAIQLKVEDEQLREWRENRLKIFENYKEA